jgi:hypothetical protein
MVQFFSGMEGGTIGQVRHGSATTTEAVRRAIQNSQESLRQLAKRYGINQKTAAKSKNRKPSPISLLAREMQDPRFSRWMKRPLSLPFQAIFS